jgi:hypothetical protein
MSDTNEHGGVTDEDLQRFFDANPNLKPLSPVNQGDPAGDEDSDPLAAPPSSPAPSPETPEPDIPPPEGEPEAAPDTTVEPEQPPTSLDDSNDFIQLGDERYPRSQIEAAASFQQRLIADPQLQQLITGYLTGQTPQLTQPTQTPTTPSQPDISAQPPTDLDLDDPSIRALYQLVTSQSEQLQRLNQGLQTNIEVQAAQQRSQIDALWNQASTSFASDHSLQPDDVERLSQVAARLGVLPQLMQGVDPITGAPSTPDPINAFTRSLEIAMWMVPEYRTRETRRTVSTMQEESQKRKLLGAVGGSSGSVARTQPPPAPGTPEAKRAMLAEVGAMLTGDWNDPNAN